MGGITLYKTFALYEEKKEFNVLKGRIPDFRSYKDSNLNGADPVLGEGLIPVEIDNTGKVIKANIESQWYSYDEKKWANAVILEDESITYQNGEEIPEENIESYFVWIPKYSYQLWNIGDYTSASQKDVNKPHEIPIKFGVGNTSDEKEGECTTPGWNEETKTYDGSNVSGESGNCEVGDYMTHPAFLSMGTNGIWVGKFETGFRNANGASASVVNVNDSSKIQIKPNIYSWRNIQISNAFLSSYNYKRDLDSHMMKNTEWGAVAYLQHSKYGSATSVRINNNSAYVTGYAAVSEPTSGYLSYKNYQAISPGEDGTYTINYKNPDSQVASTTGNYSGIYDMVGGIAESVVALGLNNNGVPIIEIDSPDSKYYEVYKKPVSYDIRILGDATSECVNSQVQWYNDLGSSINHAYARSGYWPFGNQAGVFYYQNYSGGTDSSIGYRIVLAFK